MLKKIGLLISAFLVIGLSANAQNEDFFGGAGGAGEHYTIGALEQYGKLELTKIYIQQIQKLNLMIPYAAFNPKGQAVSLEKMGIPDSKDNHSFIKKLDAGAGDYNAVLDTTLSQIVPYSDKRTIINAIIFIQDVVERLQTGL